MSNRLVLISVGNTRTRLARAVDDQLEPSIVVENRDVEAVARAALDLIRPSQRAGGGDADDEVDLVIASVNNPVANQLEKILLELLRSDADLAHLDSSVQRFGRDLAVPMRTTLEEESTVGQDRLLDALGAFARSQQACVVVDAGTAVTVDFVDGQGVFHGGVIAPGLAMMARALHEQTAALPLVDVRAQLSSRTATGPGATGKIRGRADAVEADGDETTDEAEDGGATSGGEVPFGKATDQAIALGCVSAVRGLVHQQVDRYAEFYGGYPRVIATGGDAPLLFGQDELIEAIVPDLPLVGMLEAVKLLRTLGEDGAQG